MRWGQLKAGGRSKAFGHPSALDEISVARVARFGAKHHGIRERMADEEEEEEAAEEEGDEECAACSHLPYMY